MHARFIPTPVGNSEIHCSSLCRYAVHPHACGELNQVARGWSPERGSSPRLWGTRILRPRRCPGIRFIPTPVGNSLHILHVDRIEAVHPHACGELRLLPSCGPSPRGSSPRLWGTHRPHLLLVVLQRFIPTPVGNSLRRAHRIGDNDGSSPRLWGTPLCVRRGAWGLRFIPTPVGNSLPGIHRNYIRFWKANFSPIKCIVFIAQINCQKVIFPSPFSVSKGVKETSLSPS